MPTLSASNSVFQLACGVNAVLPVLISDFERVKEEAADTLLRKIKEYCPGFELKERERIDFVDFSFRSTVGLRHAHIITRITVIISLVLCGISLAALCWAALKPDHEVSSGLFFAFVGITLIGGPLLYIARDAYLKWLYSILVIHGTNDKADAELFAGCVKAYLSFKKQWEYRKQQVNEATSNIPLMIWKLRLARIEMRLKAASFRIRSKLSFKRTR